MPTKLELNLHASPPSTSLPLLTPPLPLPPPSIMRRMRLTGFTTMLLASLINFAFSLSTLVFNMVLHHHISMSIIPSIFGTLASVLAIGMGITDLAFRRKKKNLKQWKRWTTRAICFVSLISIIFSLTTLSLDSIGAYQPYHGLSKSQKDAMITLSSLEIGTNTALAFIAAQLTWSPAHRAARSFMMVASVLLFIIGTLLVSANSQPWLPASNETPKTIGTFTLHQHVGTLVTALAVLGFAICSAIHETNRINQLFTKFIQFYVIFAGIVSSLFLVSVIMALNRYLKRSSSLSLKDSLVSDLIIDGVGLLLLIFNFVCARYLQEPPPLHLGVEVMDFNALTDIQRLSFAKRINRYGKQVPGAPTGEAAMSLMQTYADTSLEGMSCRVLRVYKLHHNPKPKAKAQEQEEEEWEKDKAWLHLDEEKMVLRADGLGENLMSPLSPVVQKPKVSKRQMRKRAALSEETLAPPSAPAPEDEAFKTLLETTEALILLTSIEQYDLTSSITGWGGRVLSRTLGRESFFKPLCVRMGLLATHFPFRQSTFYTSHTRKPVARSAAVLRAVSEWNNKLPRRERHALLLDPTYAHEDAQKAIIPSGWQSLPLAPSHIIDLAPHRGSSLSEYLKKIKYRDQEGAFKKANGEVVESTEFTEEECGEVMRLWRGIASKRKESGETPTLVIPDEDFISRLRGGNRSLLFLKANGETIASCVLFRLGSTITSDLQGLDHTLSRPLKGYFVMMQHVISIALKEGCDFVDFGPTTAKPKEDIGCKSVPIVGAVCCYRWWMGAAVSVGAKSVVNGM